MNRPPKPNGPSFSLIGFRIDSMPFSRMFSILAETGLSEPALRAMLKQAHGIDVEGDPEVFFITSEEQLDMFKKHGVKSPTLCQLLGSSECMALTGQDAKDKFTAMKED
jgi:hypothetical protein